MEIHWSTGLRTLQIDGAYGVWCILPLSSLQASEGPKTLTRHSAEGVT